MFSTIASQMILLIEKSRVRDEWINSLPKNEAVKIRVADAKNYHEEVKHRRNLEVAESGRARNFWGG